MRACKCGEEGGGAGCAITSPWTALHKGLLHIFEATCAVWLGCPEAPYKVCMVTSRCTINGEWQRSQLVDGGMRYTYAVTGPKK